MHETHLCMESLCFSSISSTDAEFKQFTQYAVDPILQSKQYLKASKTSWGRPNWID